MLKSRIKREDGKMLIQIKSFGALSKIETAILTIQHDRLKEINVPLSLDDLYWIRRMLVTDLACTEIARENVVEDINYRKSLRESE
jgi:hypothetical protein